MARTKCSEVRDAVVAKPSASQRLVGLFTETLEEIRLFELRHGEAISQAVLAGPALRHARGDLKTRALRRRSGVESAQCLEALGARLELVAVFDDDDRRVPLHLGRDDAA